MDISENDKAAMFLEDELENIKEKFESGEMKAFGLEQQQILNSFQEIRKYQSQLAMKQVAMLGDIMNQMNTEIENSGIHEEDFDIVHSMKKKEESMDDLTNMLNMLCKSIIQTNQKTTKNE